METTLLDKVKEGLARTIGLILPDDTNEENFIDRLDAALMTYHGAKRLLKAPPRGKEYRSIQCSTATRSLFPQLPSDVDSIVARIIDNDLDSIIRRRHNGHN
jgi:hypothetical protein